MTTSVSLSHIAEAVDLLDVALAQFRIRHAESLLEGQRQDADLALVGIAVDFERGLRCLLEGEGFGQGGVDHALGDHAWLGLAAITFNLTRALAGGTHANATTATIRRRIITVPARVESSARRLTLHLPTVWPWQHAWQDVFDKALRPPTTATT